MNVDAADYPIEFGISKYMVKKITRAEKSCLMFETNVEKM